MKKENDLDRQLEELLDAAAHCLGDVDDMTGAEVADMLECSGSGGEQVSQAFYVKLQDKVANIRKAGKPVPERYRELVEQFRPISEVTRDPERMQSRAQAWIKKLLGDVPEVPGMRVAVAFRNRGELSKGDQEILKNAAEELKHRVQKRGQK